MQLEKRLPARSLWAKMDRLPPCACRILARVKTDTGGIRLMTDQEISKRAGMTVPQVKGISYQTSWGDITCRQARAFSAACGVEFDNRRNWQKQMAKLKNPTCHYLRKSPEWAEMMVMIRSWKESLKEREGP
jgi:hypothetical protein